MQDLETGQGMSLSAPEPFDWPKALQPNPMAFAEKGEEGVAAQRGAVPRIFQDRGRRHGLNLAGRRVESESHRLPDRQAAIPGFEGLKWIRENSQLQKLPVVVFSSSARPEDKGQAKLMGADEYLQKPASALEFASVVDYIQKCWMPGAEQGAGISGC